LQRRMTDNLYKKICFHLTMLVALSSGSLNMKKWLIFKVSCSLLIAGW
jgi:hypothetical protein